MFELMKAGGLLMWPLLACSILSMAIIAERFWSLQTKRITPPNLVAQVWQWSRTGALSAEKIQELRLGSPLGRLLAAGLVNYQHDRVVMKESIEEVGRQVVHELERFLNTLGTIASISPLLGLLGTVFGMIQVFSVISVRGIGDASILSGGISQALYTTAAGLSIAIPTLLFYRYFQGRVDELVITMEQEALKLVEVLHGQREQES
ncbi:MAG TPA: MotA/TolQ/ExbB proton channel family protein [Gammaproteobacteria bacterium]|nr:MotA/TolQ/ExbB proton channel family protein [Gammaproteobacteria bacterium]